MKKLLLLALLLALCPLAAAASTPETIVVDSSEVHDPEFVAPRFKGGDMMRFRQWVMRHIYYPQEAARERIQGVVFVRFVVGTDGRVGDVEVLNQPVLSLGREAYRVVASSPKWTPGRKSGELVRVRYLIPIDFSIPK